MSWRYPYFLEQEPNMPRATAKKPVKKPAAKKQFPYRPLGDRVIIWPDAADAITPGGIVIPSVAQEQQRPTQGRVVAVGPGVSPALSVGDHVLYSHFVGTELEEGTQKYRIMQEKEVMAVIESA